MQFDSFQAFIAMGGYGIYVWSALFVTCGSLALLFLQSSWAFKNLKKEARAERARQARIEKARQHSA